MFKITGNKGFHMTFANGWTVSVQFGAINYCENHERWPVIDLAERGESVDAEIAAWNRDGDWYDFEYDKVLGHQSTNQVAEFIRKISNL